MDIKNKLDEEKKYIETLLKIGKGYIIEASKEKKLEEKIKKLSNY